MACNWLFELDPLLAVGHGTFERTCCNAGRHPSNVYATVHQHLLRASCEVLCKLKSFIFGHKDIRHLDVGILNSTQGNLVLNLRRLETFRALAEQEALDCTVLREITGPYKNKVREGGVANPPLAPV